MDTQQKLSPLVKDMFNRNSFLLLLLLLLLLHLFPINQILQSHIYNRIFTLPTHFNK